MPIRALVRRWCSPSARSWAYFGARADGTMSLLSWDGRAIRLTRVDQEGYYALENETSVLVLPY